MWHFCLQRWLVALKEQKQKWQERKGLIRNESSLVTSEAG
jgi:hypothetical protein